MDVVTLDFETYYSKDYSLSKKDCTTQSYIDDARFEVIGVAAKVNNGPVEWCSGTHEEIKKWLLQFDWKNSAMLAHNNLFDSSILAWRFGIYPKLLLDTLSMARALHGVDAGGSLEALAVRYGIGEKGTAVHTAIGKYRLDFNKKELAEYASYCCNDVFLTYCLFQIMFPKFNRVEIELIDLTLKMHTTPQLHLDISVLEQHLQDVQAKKRELLNTAGFDKADLMSNNKLAEVLETLGVPPPKKISARTGKETFAFSKSDEEFKALLECDDPLVQAVVAARLGVKSTLEETRTERFIKIADSGGMLPVPLKYYGALTGRWAAIDSINLQNIPRSSPLKKAIIAPPGYVIVGADLSNIELRVGLYFAGQLNKLKMLGEGLDLYKDFAASAFKVRYDDVTDSQRFVGKTCIAEGELVLTHRGLVPIEKISVDDYLWDGVEWVTHEGVVCNGERNVIEYQGLRATADHKVYLENGSACRFDQACAEQARIAITGDGGREVALLGNHKHRYSRKQKKGMYVDPRALHVRHGEMAPSDFVGTRYFKTMPFVCKAKVSHPKRAFVSFRFRYLFITKACKRYVPAVLQSFRQRVPQLWRARGQILVCFYQRMRGVFENPSELYPCNDDRPYRQQWALRTGQFAFCFGKGTNSKSAEHAIYSMERGANTCFRLERKSLRADKHSVQICKTWLYRRGYNSSSMGSGLQQTQELAANKRKVRVYDIINAGPRHRFTVSNVLVSNCQLSLIYGTGHKKLRAQIKMLSGNDIGEEFAQRVVEQYREDYSDVVRAWRNAGRVLEAIVENETMGMGLGPLELDVHGTDGIKLPSGLYLQYPELEKFIDEETGREQYKYKTRRGVTYIHPAKCFQNVIQALARCVMGEAMVRTKKKYRSALTIHDALYCVVPEEQAEQARRDIILELRKPPKWMPGIPLDAEGGYGENLSFKMRKLEQ